MAKSLPSADALGMTVARPGLGVATYSGATGNEGAQGRGLIAAGGALGNLSARLWQAQDEYDTIQAEDRYNQLQEKYNQIEHDPDNGWRTAKGENAIKPEFVKTYSDRFEEARKEVMGTLDTANARKKFSRVAASASVRARASLYQHSANERMAYDGKVANDTLTLVKDNAWRSHGNDPMFNAQLSRGRDTVASFSRRMGLSKESTALAVQKFESELWSARIKGALDSGNAMLAKELFGKATGSLTTDDKMKLDAAIKPQVRLSEAVTAVDEIHARLVSKDMNAPYPAREIDEAIRKRFADDPEQMKAARMESDYRRRAIADAQRENNKANINEVTQMFYEQKKSPTEIMRSQAYQNLGGEQKGRFIDGMERHRHVQAARAAAVAGRALSIEQTRAVAEMREGRRQAMRLILFPDTVRVMTDHNLAEYGNAVTPEAAQIVRKERDRLNKVIAGGIDQQTFITVAGEYFKDANLIRSNKDSARDRQAELGAMLHRANQNIEAIATDRGRKLDQHEEEAELRKVLETTVKIDHPFWRIDLPNDREIPIAAIPTGARNREVREQLTGQGALVSISNLSAVDKAKMLKHLRDVRPELRRMSDEVLLTRFQVEIERGAAMGLKGASTEDLRKLFGAR